MHGDRRAYAIAIVAIVASAGLLGMPRLAWTHAAGGCAHSHNPWVCINEGAACAGGGTCQTLASGCHCGGGAVVTVPTISNAVFVVAGLLFLCGALGFVAFQRRRATSRG
jgi:hypothetical protein